MSPMSMTHKRVVMDRQELHHDLDLLDSQTLPLSHPESRAIIWTALAYLNRVEVAEERIAVLAAAAERAREAMTDVHRVLLDRPPARVCGERWARDAGESNMKAQYAIDVLDAALGPKSEAPTEDGTPAPPAEQVAMSTPERGAAGGGPAPKSEGAAREAADENDAASGNPGQPSTGVEAGLRDRDAGVGGRAAQATAQAATSVASRVDDAIYHKVRTGEVSVRDIIKTTIRFVRDPRLSGGSRDEIADRILAKYTTQEEK